MAAISRADLRLVGSHAGVSIGEDGPPQMALEDIAMMRAVHGIVAGGVTVDEAVTAAVGLRDEGIEARVLDCYSTSRSTLLPCALRLPRPAWWSPWRITGPRVASARRWPHAWRRWAITHRWRGWRYVPWPAQRPPEEQRALADIDAEAIAERAGLSRVTRH